MTRRLETVLFMLEIEKIRHLKIKVAVLGLITTCADCVHVHKKNI